MMKKRFVLIILVLFYAGMFLMTWMARTLHEAGLPHVGVAELDYGLFTDEEGNDSFGVTLPKKWYQGGELYKIDVVRINNEYRTVAKRVDSLELGMENDEYYQVKNGLGARDQIIIHGLDGVTDGCEVYIVEEGLKYH